MHAFAIPHPPFLPPPASSSKRELKLTTGSKYAQLSRSARPTRQTTTPSGRYPPSAWYTPSGGFMPAPTPTPNLSTSSISLPLLMPRGAHLQAPTLSSSETGYDVRPSSGLIDYSARSFSGSPLLAPPFIMSPPVCLPSIPPPTPVLTPAPHPTRNLYPAP